MLKISGTTPNQTNPSPQAQGGEEVKVEQPESMELGRPNQASVENEAREYWQSIGGVGSLTKPTQEEIRKAALPILAHALQRREGRAGPAHRAVADFVQHAREQGWTNRPLSEVYDSSSYLDALIEFARDADWLAGEISLPDHPPVYYTFDEQTGRPVPKEDSFIQGGYLSDLFGAKLSEHRHIYPWVSTQRLPVPDKEALSAAGVSAYYTIDTDPTAWGVPGEEPYITIHYLSAMGLIDTKRPGLYPFAIDTNRSVCRQPLEKLRSASMEIAAIKDDPNLSWRRTKMSIGEIRSRYQLDEPDFSTESQTQCVIS